MDMYELLTQLTIDELKPAKDIAMKFADIAPDRYALEVRPHAWYGHSEGSYLAYCILKEHSRRYLPNCGLSLLHRKYKESFPLYASWYYAKKSFHDLRIAQKLPSWNIVCVTFALPERFDILDEVNEEMRMWAIHKRLRPARTGTTVKQVEYLSLKQER